MARFFRGEEDHTMAIVWLSGSHRTGNDEFSHGVENLAGLGIRQDRQCRARPGDEGAGALGGILDRIAGKNQVAYPLHLVGFVTPQQGSQESAVFLGSAPEEMDDGESQLSFLHVEAEGFAYGGFVANDIEDVVLNLKGGPEALAVLPEVFDRGRLCVGVDRAKLAAGGAQDGGFASDDPQIGFLIEIEIVSMVDLQQLAFANLVGGAADEARGELGIEAGAEMEAVADEVIAEENGGFVSAEVVDGRAFAAKLGFVEHVIVNERGHVHHLDDGGQYGVRMGGFSAGLSREQHEQGPEHFSAEATDMTDQSVHGSDRALQLGIEKLLNLVQLRLDAIGQRREQRSGRVGRGIGHEGGIIGTRVKGGNLIGEVSKLLKIGTSPVAFSLRR
jgi:hypothetical protein